MNQNINQSIPIYFQIAIGLFLLIIGALFTGIAGLIRDSCRLKKEKLSTAYAFKGEIETILKIIKKRQYIELFEADIKRKETGLNDLNKQANINNPIELDIPREKEKILKLLVSSTFRVNRDVFFVKNALKNKIGLLEKTAENIVLFYGYCNAFLLDIKDNEENNKSYREQIRYSTPYDVNSVIEGSIRRDKERLEIAEEIIKSGDESIKELNKFISKLWRLYGWR